MIGRFIVWIEDQYGHVNRAFTWSGRACDGIARARQEANTRGIAIADIWATPAASNKEITQ